MDFRQDSSTRKERIKGMDKRILGKWSRKKFIKQLEASFEKEGVE